LLLLRPPPPSTLFPYTTLFRSWGTAANICSMVFGNMGNDCATGVAFTRDPATGENVFYGEYLINAQGEDVVAGIRTPEKIAKLRSEEHTSELQSRGHLVCRLLL